MRLSISTLDPLSNEYSHRVRARVRYTTESLRPHRIASFEEFEQHTPYQKGWVVVNRLSVHPEDVDKAVHLLGKAGIEAKKEPPSQW